MLTEREIFEYTLLFNPGHFLHLLRNFSFFRAEQGCFDKAGRQSNLKSIFSTFHKLHDSDCQYAVGIRANW